MEKEKVCTENKVLPEQGNWEKSKRLFNDFLI